MHMCVGCCFNAPQNKNKLKKLKKIEKIKCTHAHARSIQKTAKNNEKIIIRRSNIRIRQ